LLNFIQLVALNNK